MEQRKEQTLVPRKDGNLMREQAIENYFGNKVRDQGGRCIKVVSPSMTGLPDRMVLLPFGKIAFVEFKAPGEALRPAQRIRQKMLVDLGFEFYCVDCKEKADMVLRVLKNGI